MAYAVQSVMMASIPCTEAVELWSIQNALQAYVFYDTWSVILEADRSRNHRYAVQWRATCYAGGDHVVAPAGAGDGVVHNKPLNQVMRFEVQ